MELLGHRKDIKMNVADDNIEFRIYFLGIPHHHFFDYNKC